jgi:hypothetical protein
MRLAVSAAAAALAVAVGFSAVPAAAEFFEGQSVIFGRRTGPQAPWCSNQDNGHGIEEDCSFRSFEQCRRIATGINSSFCTPNPRYDLNVRVIRRNKGDRRRR